MSDYKHLWEFDHPYYCNEGCYYVGGLQYHEVHSDHDSWAAFLEAWGDVDPDYNLLFRWDWAKADPANYTLNPGHEDDETADLEEALKTDTLKLYFFLQRKAKPFSHHIVVTEADEPSVREWLAKKADHMRKLWEPLLDGAQS